MNEGACVELLARSRVVVSTSIRVRTEASAAHSWEKVGAGPISSHLTDRSRLRQAYHLDSFHYRDSVSRPSVRGMRML